MATAALNLVVPVKNLHLSPSASLKPLQSLGFSTSDAPLPPLMSSPQTCRKYLGRLQTLDLCLKIVQSGKLSHLVFIYEVDLDNIDENEFLEFQGLEFLDCILEEGDMLYIPPKWWHYVRSLTTSMLVSFWWSDYDASTSP